MKTVEANINSISYSELYTVLIDRLASHNFSFAIHEIKIISTNRVDRIRGVLRTYEHSTNQDIVNRFKNLYDQNNSIKSVLAV